MKKFLFYSLLVAGGMCLTTACGDDEPEPITPPTEQPPGGSDDDDDPNNDTPSVSNDAQAQQELDRVGQELMNKIDADKFKPLIRLAQYCNDTFFADEDEMEPDWGYDPTYPYAALKGMMGELRSVARGDIARMANRRMITKLYQLSEYYGTFTWNEDNKEWDETPNNNALVYKFKHNGKDCECKITGTGRAYTWNWTEDDEKTRVEIPEHVTATVVEGNTVLAQLTVNTTTCDQDGHNYAIHTQLDAAGYSVKGEITDDNAKAQAQASLLLGNETLITGSCTVNGKHLADEEQFKDDYDAAENLKTGEITLSLLNSIQVDIQADNRTKDLQWLDYDGYYYYSEYRYPGATEPSIYRDSDSETAKANAQKALDAINQYVTARLLFRNGGYTVPIAWDLKHSETHWGDSESSSYGYYGYDGYWDVNPLMVFNDATYTFDNYFTDVRFSSLIDMYNQLAEDFEKIVD